MLLIFFTVLRFLLYEILICLVCFGGDNSYGLNVTTDSTFLRACLDSLSHGCVAFLCWAVVIDLTCQKKELMECCGCMSLAMIIDSDHFVAAGSLNLKLALSLKNRPLYHASTLIPIVAAILIFISYVRKDSRFTRLSAIFTVAWTSHHMRDAVRRGLWFPPFGSTRPLSTTTYISITMMMPVVFRLLRYISPQVSVNTQTNDISYQDPV